MASALQLTATATIINGHGLATNFDVLSQIGIFQSQPTLSSMSNIFVNATSLNANIASTIVPILSTIGTGANQGQFLLDLYPSNVSPVCNANIPTYSGVLKRVSGAVQAQATGPFSHGIAGFANLFSLCNGHAFQVFDTVASIKILQNKTYGQSGLNFTGQLDLATGGVGKNGALLADVIEGWGTMYDTTHLNLISDPYVFGQNLLNQGLSDYGNLGKKLTATGLDITDITKIPTTVTVVSTQPSTTTISSEVGEVVLPTVENVYSTNTVTGNSIDVIKSVYASITGNDLISILIATGFTGPTTNLKTLADFLDFNKVVSPDLGIQLNPLGITNFEEFGNYIHSRVGHGSFISWKSLAETLRDIEVPQLVNAAPTTSETNVLSASTISTLRSVTGSGSGVLTNHVIADYLGACAGMPYAPMFTTINNEYDGLITPVQTAVQKLDQSVIDTYNTYIATGGDGTGESAPGAGDGTPPGIIHSEWVESNVALVQASLNNLPQAVIADSQTAFHTMLDHLNMEVININKADGTFTAAFSPSAQLKSFGETIGSTASDRNRLETYQFFANLITNDDHGDVIRSVIAETMNAGVLATTGIALSNDPQPMTSLASAQAQGISITDYLTQNK